MNSNIIQSTRRELTTWDLKMVESWVREFGRSSIKAWSGLTLEQQADVCAAAFTIAAGRVHKRGVWKIPRLQVERLARRWSLLTCSQKLISAGWIRCKPEEIHGLEVNPRPRGQIDKTWVRACEDAFGLAWEDLIELMKPERVPVPARVYALPGQTDEE